MKSPQPHVQELMQKLLDQVEDLKPLPATVVKTLRLMDQDDVTLPQIVANLAIDQAIAARLLKLANSAYYGFSYPATTLTEAVMRLGFRRTKNLLYALSYSSLLGRRVASYNLGSGELWQHSVAVATVAERLAEQVGYASPDEAYTAGLLHDIGKLMLDQFFKLNWEQLLKVSQTNQLTLIEAEERLLGMNHAQLGGELAKKWNLPLCLVEGIAYHHLPMLANKWPHLAALVHVANAITLRSGIGLMDPYFMNPPLPAALALLSLQPADWEALVSHYRHLLEVNRSKLISFNSEEPVPAEVVA